MKNYTDDQSINHNKSYICGIWNIPELKDIFLGDCAMAFLFHVVDDFIPKNKPYEIYLWKIYFHNLMQYKPIIGRINACHGISIRIIFKEVA